MLNVHLKRLTYSTDKICCITKNRSTVCVHFKHQYWFW